ncbi:MAG: methyltransferase [Candidatus Omnitrophota bacterium]
MMKLKSISKIIGFVLIQALSAVNFAWAGNTIASFSQPVDYLSPAINIKAVDFQIGFKTRGEFLRQRVNPLWAKLDITENSPVKIFLQELGVKIDPEVKAYSDERIPVIFENTQIFSENLNFDPTNYSAKLLTHQGRPLLFYIETGYHPMEDYSWRYFIDFSAFTAFNQQGEDKNAIDKAVRELKKQINNSIFSRRMPATHQCSLFSFGDVEVPVILDVHPPNDIPSDFLITETEKMIQPGDAILDIGTGSGKVGAILAKVSGAHVVAIDNKKTEIANAKVTAAALEVQENMEVIESDLFNALKGKKFKYMYFYPPTLKTKEMSAAEFFGVKKGVAEISEQESKELFDRLFSEFADYLEKNGVLYLALMKENKVAYEKIKEYQQRGIIITKSLYRHFSKEEEIFEIFEIKPGETQKGSQIVNGQKKEDTAETIAKKIYDAFESSLFRQGEYKFTPAVAGKIAEIYIFGANEDIIGSVRLTVNDERTIILSNAEIFEKKHQQKGLFTEVLRKINEATSINVRLRNYQIRNLETLYALCDRLLPEMAEKVQVSRVLHDNLAAKLRKLGNIVDISDLDSPLTNAHRKAGYNNFLLVAERGINDLGYEGDILIIEAYKQKPLLNPENGSSRTIEKFGVSLILSVEQAI